MDTTIEEKRLKRLKRDEKKQDEHIKIAEKMIAKLIKQSVVHSKHVRSLKATVLQLQNQITTINRTLSKILKKP